MAARPLSELIDKARSSPEMTPYPKSFARCLDEMTRQGANGADSGSTRSTTFITACGLRVAPAKSDRPNGV